MPLAKSTPLLSLLIAAAPAVAQINAGTLPPTPTPPFELTKVAQFDQPWRIAFLPDGRMRVTQKPGRLFIATEAGGKLEVTGVPAVQYQGQNGLLGVYLAPPYANDVEDRRRHRLAGGPEGRLARPGQGPRLHGATVTPAEHWTVGFRVRDVAQAPDGALWLIEDAHDGGLYRLTPK